MKKLPDACLVEEDVADTTMSNDFVKSGSVFPKVNPESIADLMRKVEYETHRVGTTSTIVATAVLNYKGSTFTLAHESTACADPRNFNQEKGEFYAIKKASLAARDKLWELEGYTLFKALADSVSK